MRVHQMLHLFLFARPQMNSEMRIAFLQSVLTSQWEGDGLPVASLAGSGTTKRPLACKKMESLSIALGSSDLIHKTQNRLTRQHMLAIGFLKGYGIRLWSARIGIERGRLRLQGFDLFLLQEDFRFMALSELSIVPFEAQLYGSVPSGSRVPVPRASRV